MSKARLPRWPHLSLLWSCNTSLSFWEVEQGHYLLHRKCFVPIITNHQFADDVLFFYQGNEQSAQSLGRVLTKFANDIWLQINKRKSFMLFTPCHDDIKRNIDYILDIPIGSFPFKYLGIPITRSRLTLNDYLPLFERIARNLTKWKRQSLSYAGRVELIQSICYGSINYWLATFKIPEALVDKLN